jgi:CDP-diacylglycerol---glycerol-3-phosphate 3-phosphatidyltransferase
VFGNWPTIVTWTRIGMIPLLVVVFYLPFPWARPAAAIVFAVAAITDWLDGHLARRLDQTTPFGAFLDPVADKLIVTTALVLIVQQDPRAWVALCAMVIIGREIAITALREWMATIGERKLIQVSWLGKVKTTFQITAVIMLIYQQDLPLWPFSSELALPIYWMGLVALVGAALMTLWSMYLYLTAAWTLLRDS